MFAKKRINNLLVNNILIDGATFGLDRRRQRYEMLLDGEVIYTFFGDWDINYYHFHETSCLNILHSVLRKYMDTPVRGITNFESDFAFLSPFVELLKACDKRIGLHHQIPRLFQTTEPMVRKAIQYRMPKKEEKQ